MLTIAVCAIVGFWLWSLFILLDLSVLLGSNIFGFCLIYQIMFLLWIFFKFWFFCANWKAGHKDGKFSRLQSIFVCGKDTYDFVNECCLRMLFYNPQFSDKEQVFIFLLNFLKVVVFCSLRLHIMCKPDFLFFLSFYLFIFSAINVKEAHFFFDRIVC